MRLKKRITNKKEKTAPVIDLTSVDTSQSNIYATGSAGCDIGISFSEVLQDNNAWLTDKIIHPAQVLIRLKYPSVRGLQDPIFRQSLCFEVMKEEFVQVLHSDGNHWITISTISCPPATVLYTIVSIQSFPHRRKRKYVLYLLQRRTIDIVFANVKSQDNVHDCGIFAIAFATALSEGKRPEELLFKKETLRKHLLKCLQEENITQFPCKTVKRGYSVKNREKIDIFCKCRTQEGGSMIQCSWCKEWYHKECIKVPLLAWKNRKYKWVCEFCNWTFLSRNSLFNPDIYLSIYHCIYIVIDSYTI